MAWKNIESTMIAAHDYDPNMRVLHVRFRNTGEVFSLQGVPEEIAKGLDEAESAGKFYNANIKGKFHAI